MLLIFSSPPAKGSSVEVTLNKSDLVDILTPLDEYFSDPDNIKAVVVKYVSSPGRQKKSLMFDFELNNPTSHFATHPRARSTFLIKDIVVYNHNSDHKKIDRGHIPSVESLDINME
jgi:hypothetical protein